MIGPLLGSALLAVEALSLWDFLSCVRPIVLRDALPVAGVGCLVSWVWGSAAGSRRAFATCVLRGAPLLLLRLYPWFERLPVPADATGWLPDLSALCLLALVLAACAAMARRLLVETPPAPWRGALLLAVVHGALIYGLLAERHAAFANASTYYPHAFWNLAHGTWQETASDFDVPVPLFAVHFYVTAFLIAPWARLFPTLDGIGALQALVVAVGGLALARGLARGRGEGTGRLAHLLYVGHPFVLLSVAWGVTIDAFGIGLLAAAIGTLVGGRARIAGVLLALCVGCKESLVLVSIPLGAYAWFALGRRRWGVAAVAGSLAWFALAAAVQTRLLGGTYGPGAYVDSTLHLATHPLEALRHYGAPGRLSAWALLLAPVLGIALVELRLFLCAVPIVLVTLADNDARILLEEYHLGPAAVIVSVAAALAAARRSTGPGRTYPLPLEGTPRIDPPMPASRWLLAACAISQAFLNPVSVWNRYGLAGLPDGPRREWLARKLKEIPADVSVSCTSELRAALGFRKTVFPFFPEGGGRQPEAAILSRIGRSSYRHPSIRDADFVVLDLDRVEHLPGGAESTAVCELLGLSGYGVRVFEGALLVLERGEACSLQDAASSRVPGDVLPFCLGRRTAFAGTEVSIGLDWERWAGGTTPTVLVSFLWDGRTVHASDHAAFCGLSGQLWRRRGRDRFWVPLPRALRPSKEAYQVILTVRDGLQCQRLHPGEIQVLPRTLFSFRRSDGAGLDW